MFGISVTRLVIYGIIAAVVIGVLFMLRHELIEKGRNLVYAEDNAARVKAQDEQAVRDKTLIAAQNSYIVDLQNSGQTVKERIRVVQAPCDKDGLGDPRLDDAADWVRGRLQGNSGQTNDQSKAGGSLPAAAGAPAKR